MFHKTILQWFNKESADGEGMGTSAALDHCVYFLDKPGISDEPQIYNGRYDVKNTWLQHIQPYFQHQINSQQYDYQLAFRYV